MFKYQEENVEAVKAHAIKHYEEGGWDIVVETMGDEETLEIVGHKKTKGGAIAVMAERVGVTDSYRFEIVNA